MRTMFPAPVDRRASLLVAAAFRWNQIRHGIRAAAAVARRRLMDVRHRYSDATFHTTSRVCR